MRKFLLVGRRQLVFATDAPVRSPVLRARVIDGSLVLAINPVTRP